MNLSRGQLRLFGNLNRNLFKFFVTWIRNQIRFMLEPDRHIFYADPEFLRNTHQDSPQNRGTGLLICQDYADTTFNLIFDAKTWIRIHAAKRMLIHNTERKLLSSNPKRG